MQKPSSIETPGVLCALPQELGPLEDLVRGSRTRQGLTILELEVAGGPVLACVAGVGKALAAQAAAVLMAEGADAILVVGVCGGLRRSLPVGTLVHCTTAFQTDLAVRETRRSEADANLREAWQAVVPGPEGWFLSADRPVINPWRRLRLARAFAGPCIADMETAAVGSVCARAGVPWAGLRAVTDGAGALTAHQFRKNLSVQAGRAADTVPRLLSRLERP